MVLAPSKGWDTFPPKEDTTMGANLTRIKALRNRLAHLPKMKIKKKAYQELRADLIKVHFFFTYIYILSYKLDTTKRFRNHFVSLESSK